MKQELKDALDIITRACSSVVANLETHMAVQKALHEIEEELQKKAK